MAFRKVHQTDLLIVGSGVAGLSAALEVVRAHTPLRLLLLTRDALGGHGASPLAQGGIAAAIDPSDSPALHAQDTRKAAAGLAHSPLVEVLTEDGPDRIAELLRIGARFDRRESGELALGLEGAHSRRRILHAHGDRTGAEVTRALRDAVLASKRVDILEHMEALELHAPAGQVEGLVARDRDGALHLVLSRATLLATGGAGRAFLRTTSPPGLDGDGLALAARAGTELMDLEFVQFHPTALYVQADPLPLVTEALRGAGARLVDAQGEPVLDPDGPGELSSRDRVSRAVWARMQEGHAVFLDCRDAPGSQITERFPGVYALCLQHGIDPLLEPVPVTPAAHYHMGGVRVDAHGRSSLAGLWVAGELAASGLHGANRLASNSLLEGLVFGKRAARSMLATAPDLPSPPPPEPSALGDLAFHRDASRRLPPDAVTRIRTLLWEKVGVIRHHADLEEAVTILDAMDRDFAGTPRNLLLVAKLIAFSALQRKETRGSHFRSDFPDNAPGPPTHSVIRLSPERPQQLIWNLQALDTSHSDEPAVRTAVDGAPLPGGSPVHPRRAAEGGPGPD